MFSETGTMFLFCLSSVCFEHFISMLQVCYVLHAYVQFCTMKTMIRRTPLPTFSDIAITDHHPDTIFPAQGTLGTDFMVY